MKAPADSPQRFDCAGKCVDAVLEKVGKHVVLGLPLALGKANHFANALYARAAADPSISLTIFTALTLERPLGKGELGRRFVQPLLDRLYNRYQDLAYTSVRRKGLLPPNIKVCEFFMQPGALLGNADAQQNYVSSNYTYVPRDLMARGVNVVAQMISPGADTSRFSLSCNPDLTLPVLKMVREQDQPLVLVGEINPQLPYMSGDAELPASEFEFLLEGETFDTPLFAAPTLPISLTEYALAFHIASLVADGGTLQLGIGALSDAISQTLGLRQKHNAEYRSVVQELTGEAFLQLRRQMPPQLESFQEGLYGASEMVPPGFLYLRRAGVLTREVRVEEGLGTWLHGGFFLGPEFMYRELREMPQSERAGICMTGIDFINELGEGREGKIADRRKARFINSAMMVTLSGSVVSDGLADNQVVSGVGGQYNFVAQAQELPDGRSIIALPSTRTKNGGRRSNILWEYSQCTIPRHLRDIVVTEYGAADLRGKSDRDVMVAMLSICDSEFQGELLEKAQSTGKIEKDYRLPTAYTENTPERIMAAFDRQKTLLLLPYFPLGSDFTDEEALLAIALKSLNSGSKKWWKLLPLILSGRHIWKDRSGEYEWIHRCLERMGFEGTDTYEHRLEAYTVARALELFVDRRRPLRGQ